MVAAVAGLLAVGAAYDSTVKSILTVTASLGLPAMAIKTATRIAMSAPVGDAMPPGSRTDGAARVTASKERLFRATYLLNAAKRINNWFREGIVPTEIVRRERRHFEAHRQAQARRRKVAREIDAVAARYGSELGWYAKMDSRTSAECRWANGRNFRVDRRPPIGYPGTVHPNCRCVPGKPHASGKSVYPNRDVRKSA